MDVEKHVEKYWDKNAEGYQEDSDIKIGIHYGPGAPFEDKLKLLGNIKGKKIIELGCGGAQCGIAMAKKGANVTGVDQSKEQLKFAQKLAEKNDVKINLVQGSFQNLKKFKSSSYDIVFSAMAFQYSPDLDKLFKQIYRILKKQGTLVFSLDHPFFDIVNPENLKIDKSYFDVGKQVEKHKEGPDLVIYRRTFAQLTNKLINAGFVIERVVEPDSRIKHKGDPWYGLWGYYLPKTMNLVPPTIIFKARKLK